MLTTGVQISVLLKDYHSLSLAFDICLEVSWNILDWLLCFQNVKGGLLLDTRAYVFFFA